MFKIWAAFEQNSAGHFSPYPAGVVAHKYDVNLVWTPNFPLNDSYPFLTYLNHEKIGRKLKFFHSACIFPPFWIQLQPTLIN